MLVSVGVDCANLFVSIGNRNTYLYFLWRYDIYGYISSIIVEYLGIPRNTSEYLQIMTNRATLVLGGGLGGGHPPEIFYNIRKLVKVLHRAT